MSDIRHKIAIQIVKARVPGYKYTNGDLNDEAELVPDVYIDNILALLELLNGKKKAVCNAHCYWWDGEYEGDCELPEGHQGDHYDGDSWFNDDNECTDFEHGTEANTLDNHIKKYLPHDGKYRHIEFDVAILPDGKLTFATQQKEAKREAQLSLQEEER